MALYSPDLADRLNALPTPAPLLVRISAVVNSRDSCAKDIAEVLKTDPVIVSKVLRLANSAYVGMPKTVSSLQNAIVLLGQKRIAALVTSALVTSALSGSTPHFPLKLFRRHSTGVALIAESIARHLQRYHMVEPDVCFSAALLHDIGKLVIVRLDPRSVETVMTASLARKQSYHESENSSQSHTVVGKMLAEQWNFPDDLAQVIANHHITTASTPMERIVHIVHLADAMAHVIGMHSFEGEIGPPVSNDALASIALPLERLRVIAEEILHHESEVGSLAEFFS